MVDVVHEAFPWSALLTRDEVDEFVGELVSADNPVAVGHVIDAWRHTAQVWGDPELAAVLSAPSGNDFGAVPEPGARR